MSYIQSIGLAKAPYLHLQQDIYHFMLSMYQVTDDVAEKMKRMYQQCKIETRYSAIRDFSLPKSEWTFFEQQGITSVEKRMKQFFEIAPSLGAEAVRNCISNEQLQQVTHLITVSCTGLSAPGLDIHLMQLLQLPTTIHRSSINFMGCYAGIQALKQANAICNALPNARVLIVDVELCTLHFQDAYSMDNIAASLLFGDGAAAAYISNEKGLYQIDDFYSEVAYQGYKDMAWNVSASGFQMTLSAYIPFVIGEQIEPMLRHALSNKNIRQNDIQHWAIHPGGKKILSEIEKVLSLASTDLDTSYAVLREFGNMSSVTIFYVLEAMRSKIKHSDEQVFAAAFGPGLTIETMFLSSC